MNVIIRSIALAAILAVGPLAAQASVFTYSDRASFDAAAGSTTLIDFDWSAAQAVYYRSTLTVGDVTFTQADNKLYVFGPTNYSTTGTTRYLNNNAGQYNPVVVDFASGVYAVGLDIAWLSSHWGNATGSMTFELSNGDSFSSSVVGPLYNTATSMGFVGFISDIAFSSFKIIDPSNSVMIDNFAYTATPSVPEPATLTLIAASLLGVAVSRRRRHT